MNGDRLTSTHHVARHCRRRDLFWNGSTPTHLLRDAFEPRPSEDDGLSATWLEYFQGDQQQRLAQARATVCAFLTPNVKWNRLAVLNVGKIEGAVPPVDIHVIEDAFIDPAPGNPAHALIKEVADLQDIRVREALASKFDATDIHSY